jgi:hypothetical protein
MFKRDYNAAINFAGMALTGNTADNLRPWNSSLSTMQYYDLQAEYTKSTLRGNLLLQEANSVWGRSYASLRYGLGTNVFTKIFNTPNPTGWVYDYPAYGTPALYNVPKFFEHFVKESLSASSGNPYNTIPLFTAEEVVLNRAEAYVRVNNRTAALNDLNAFVSKNIESYAPSDNMTAKKAVDFFKMPGDTTGAIVNTALEFKKAFFLHEGLRWFDILRLKIPVTHTTVSGEVLTLTADDKRKVLQLPILTKQAGLEPNAR